MSLARCHEVSVPRERRQGLGLKTNDILREAFLNDTACFTTGNKPLLIRCCRRAGIDDGMTTHGSASPNAIRNNSCI